MRNAWLVVALALAPAVLLAQEETVPNDRFYKVMLYRSAPTPPFVVVFISGDGGWNQGVIDMSRTMAGLDALVIGIDIRYYMRALRNEAVPCSDAAADLDAVTRWTEKRLDYPSYVAPWLAGYSSGATMVYAALVQAPPAMFQGAISFGFCPDLALVKPFCAGHGLEFERGPRGKGFVFHPSQALEQPWVAFQGDQDQLCDPQATKAFAARTAHGEVVDLAHVGHGFAVLKNWSGQFAEVFRRLTKADTPPSP